MSSLSDVSSIYKKSGFFAFYGLSVIIVFFIVISFVLGIIYYEIKSKIKPIKNDWANRRCDPSVIPFAGMIYNPDDKSFFQATSENFQQCGQDVTKSLAGEAMSPFNYLLDGLMSVFGSFFGVLGKIRGFMNRIREQIVYYVKLIFSFIMNIMVGLQPVFIAIKDVFAKLKGIGASIIFTVYGVYLMIMSAFANVLNLLALFTAITGALVIVFWTLYSVLMAFVFTIPAALVIFPIAVSFTIVFVILLFFLVLVFWLMYLLALKKAKRYRRG